jgi:DNA-binding XRE family transcriptional regulator
MSIPLGFTDRQLRIWGMRRDGLPQAEIARRLGVTRQAINKVIGGIDDQVSLTLKQVARAAKIETRHVESGKGILLGYSHETNDRVIITFSTKHGAQVWHYYSGLCGQCEVGKTCRETILDEAEERGIMLTDEEKKNNPAEIARIVFSRILPGLEP